MRLANLCRKEFLSAVLILLAVLLPSPASAAEDAAIRKQIAKLANRDADTRQDAIEALAQTRDERVAHTLQAMFQGNLILWQGKVYVRGETSGGPVPSPDMPVSKGNKSFVSLLDPLTQEPALDQSKKPIKVDPDEPRDIRPTGQERPLLSTVIKFLQDFSSTDLEKRALAVRRLGENPDPTFVSMLDNIAETDADARRAAHGPGKRGTDAAFARYAGPEARGKTESRKDSRRSA